MKSPGEMTVEELRAEIGDLTNREPVSKHVAHLRQRLSDLRKRDKAGEDVGRSMHPNSIMTVSMPMPAREALQRIIVGEKCGASDLTRRALAAWARRHGYKAEAEAIEA